MLKEKTTYIAYALLFAAVVVITFFILTAKPAGATQSQVTICHHTPANSVTLNFQNQQSYSGHLGTPHNNETFDTNGACVQPSPGTSPTIGPSIGPSVEPTLSIVPTITPEPQSGGAGDGRSDGLSDGKHQAPDGLGCAVHECPTPQGPPATGRG